MKILLCKQFKKYFKLSFDEKINRIIKKREGIPYISGYNTPPINHEIEISDSNINAAKLILEFAIIIKFYIHKN